jgi:hypothetical protein
MSMARLARNVEAYDPEADPANIDPEALRLHEWPSTLVECVKQQRFGSEVLDDFERNILRQWSAPRK